MAFPSAPPSSASHSDPSHSFVLPPGVPSSSGVASAGSDSMGGGKRGRESGELSSAKRNKVSFVHEYRDGKGYAIPLDKAGLRLPGDTIVKGSFHQVQESSTLVLQSQEGFDDIREGIDDNFDEGREEDEQEGEFGEEREDGEIGEDNFVGEDRDFHLDDGFGTGTPEYSPNTSGDGYGGWINLKFPYSVALHNGQPKALHNASNRAQIPIDQVRFATLEGGGRMFSVRQKKTSFKIRERAEVFGTKQDKQKVLNFMLPFFLSSQKLPLK